MLKWPFIAAKARMLYVYKCLIVLNNDTQCYYLQCFTYIYICSVRLFVVVHCFIDLF